ncbi:hypothetical protein LQK89_17265 (plasmid) [Curtobacterium sp. C1]|jgi:hypothetical protein|uniref:hypothetical protein n=1 Tax=Microbacteriaceae TaxID=85023 RepID=UPI001C206F0E|nr:MULTISPECIES: hypothetical protein [Microbacteriaceae]UFU15919.1 hypothetical protein LQK89_17265 [Curtobacterium sp. C1]WIB62074.1 hypothetical protein DEJ13_17955 [Curtobacterium sp. MCLR17_007]
MSITTPRTGHVPAAEADRRVDFADAALGAAGHQVTDPILRDYARRVAEGTMTAEAAIAAGMAHIDAR